jgi:hypothetical protein
MHLVPERQGRIHQHKFGTIDDAYRRRRSRKRRIGSRPLAVHASATRVG